MLKSTHRAAASVAPLPAGWTEHRAPTGHPYYYNSETKQSTYTRPVAEPKPEPEELQIDYGASLPDPVVQASMGAMQQFHKYNDPQQQAPRRFTGGKSYQDRSRLNRQGDRPKSKTPIANCEPWVLVKTKLGRRFVHNTETKESLWKFPSDVMMAVIDMDRIEWEKKKDAEKAKEEAVQPKEPAPVEQPKPVAKQQAERPTDYDSDEYEEVEVTDDEVEENDDTDPSTKRPRLDSHLDPSADHQQPLPAPQELTEDDIAWQLAQMEADEEDPGFDYDQDDPEPGIDDNDEDLDEDGGVPVTLEDKSSIFRTLLDDHRISPFGTFDSLIDTNTPTANALISDDRWLALPNMSSRRAAFDLWSRDRVAQQKAAGEAAANQELNGSANGISAMAGKQDPRVVYSRFLAAHATPKLYWPEFKRKFRKEPAMTDRYFADKDREKLYREYIPKLKLSEKDRKKEFLALLRSVPAADWQSLNGGQVPVSVEKDLRFYFVREESERKELVDGYVAGLLKR